MPELPDRESSGLGTGPERNLIGLRTDFIDKLSWIITTIWVVSMILDAVPKLDYNPPPIIHPAFMAVVGAAYVGSMVRPGDNK